MKDYIYLGPTPADEDCAQVGDSNYRIKAIKETEAFIKQLYREYPETNDFSCSFRVKWENHDFGSYAEVVVQYDDDLEHSANYAFMIENTCPTSWDNEALKELNHVG